LAVRKIGAGRRTRTIARPARRLENLTNAQSVEFFDSWQAAAISGVIAALVTIWFIRRYRRSRHHFGPVGTGLLAIIVFVVLFMIVFFAFI
jgi:hypothetical protein